MNYLQQIIQQPPSEFVLPIGTEPTEQGIIMNILKKPLVASAMAVAAATAIAASNVPQAASAAQHADSLLPPTEN